MTGRQDQDARFAARMAEVKRAASIEQIVRRRVPKLRRAGREFEALCPFHEERTPSFTVSPAKGLWHCFGCGAGGDAISFVREFDGLVFMDALAVVESESGIAAASDSPAPAQPAQAATCNQPLQVRGDDPFIDSGEAGQLVWNAARHARGTLVDTYLRSRGIDPEASGILEVLRFHPAAPVSLWRWDGLLGPDWLPRDGRTCPAMLVPIGHVAGELGARDFVMQAVELVFLAADGSGKMKFAPRRDGKVPPSRKIWGDAGGGACPVPPVGAGEWWDCAWIDVDLSRDPLVIGEGLESTLSLMARTPQFRGGFAALSLNNLQGYPLRRETREGAVTDLVNPRPDPARAPFVVADAGAVIIGVDADMKPLRAQLVIERPKGAPLRRDVTGAERADLCMALASAHWRAAGAGPVHAVRPAMGMDFNDEVRAGG